MGAAHDAITHNDRKNALVIDEREDLAGDVEVVAHVSRFDFQSRSSVGSASSDGTMPTATFVAWVRSGP